MPNRPTHTASLAAFKRRSAEFLERMRTSHEPITLTVNGNPEMVVQTAEDYRRLVDEVEASQAIEGIRKGLASMRSGDGAESDAVFRELESRYPHLRRG